MRGVCKRFNEFKELDAAIRAHFPAATFTATFPPDQAPPSAPTPSPALFFHKAPQHCVRTCAAIRAHPPAAAAGGGAADPAPNAAGARAASIYKGGLSAGGLPRAAPP